jgi:hypothetical protein
MENMESNSNFYEDSRKVGILIEGEIRDIPGSFQDSMKDAWDIGYAQVYISSIHLYIVSLLVRSTVNDLSCNSLLRSR